MADAIEAGFEFGSELIQLVEIAVIGVIAYFAYKFFNQSNCGANKDQQCCRTADVNTAACLKNSDDTTCGWADFLAFNCYSPAGSQATVDTARQQSSATAGAVDTIGSWFNDYSPFTFSGGVLAPNYQFNMTDPTQPPPAPTPGLPSGYNPSTGTIVYGPPYLGPTGAGTTVTGDTSGAPVFTSPGLPPGYNPDTGTITQY